MNSWLRYNRLTKDILSGDNQKHLFSKSLIKSLISFRYIFIFVFSLISFNGYSGSANVVLYAWNQQDNEYQVLMGHNIRSQHWTLCRGKIEDGELPKTAACRETYEETIRCYGSDTNLNLLGKINSFLPNGLTREVQFIRTFQNKTKTHYLYFKEVSYIDSVLITKAADKELDIQKTLNPYKENNDYGWLSWKIFAYHAIKTYFNGSAPLKRDISENIKGAMKFKSSYCDAFTWSGFRELQGAKYVLDITNEELARQALPKINTFKELDNYLNNFYYQKR